MKVGQAMSAMEAALPDQLVGPYREALVRLQEAAPAMPAAMVHEQLDRSFPGGWRELFREFDERPVAAASVGQVHRATWHDGAPVAVKIQYPGAGEALVADVGMLQALVPVMRAAAPGLDARQLIAELRDRLADEVDYVLEADAQMAFADAYRDDPDILVPDVVAVEDQVLITRWVDGTPLSRVIATGSREERDRAGLLLVRLLASGPVRAGRLHGDPHPGNFRLLPDGRLAVLDFGATEALPDGWPARLGPLLAAGRDGDARALHRIAADAGLLRPAEVIATPTCSRCSAPTWSRCAPRSTGSPAHGCRSRPGAPPIPSAPRPARSAGWPSRRGICCCSGWRAGWSASSARWTRPFPSTPRCAGGCPATTGSAPTDPGTGPGVLGSMAGRRRFPMSPTLPGCWTSRRPPGGPAAIRRSGGAGRPGSGLGR